mgnify:FL=1
MNTKNVGLYIHIPFCKQKCQYCDFKSYAGKENLIDTYIRWLEFELKGVGEGNRLDYENNLDDLAVVKSIYIGGGTPSFIDGKYIEEILSIANEYYTVDDNAEITIEVNPGTIDKDKFETYLRSGINRISIGLQSTHDRLLKELGRIHTYEDFLNTYNLARSVGFKNINVDLMLGLPNQSLQDLEESLKEIIKLNPEHISVYSLIIEEGTLFYKKLEMNEIVLPDDELERKMYWGTKKKLENAGYVHYEISNFAKPGFESKHNLSCWNQEEYIGIGVAAHSYTNDVRYSNIDSIEEYIKNYEEDNETDNFVFHEKQTKISKMKEFMMLGLRKIQGIRIQDFKNKFGENPIYLYRKELEKLVNEELLEIDGDIIKLTNKGIDLANLVWEEFV